jgi:rRNA biogenesis protein RRP5
MAGKKRQSEDAPSAPKPKKAKVASPVKVKEKKEKKEKKKPRSENAAQSTSNVAPEEIDFPRGGGTSLTPLEVKTLRVEAVKEADDELFKVRGRVYHYAYQPSLSKRKLSG